MFRFRHLFILSIILWGLLVVSPAFSEENLTLQDALQMAGANNPQVQAIQARLGVSQAQILTAGARLNPSLVTDNGIAEKTYRLGIEKTFELGGKRRKRIAVAEAQRDTTLASIKTLLLDLRTNVRRSYTNLYSLSERQKSFDVVVQTTDRLLDIARKRQQAGDIAQVDVLQVEIAVLNTRNDAETLTYQVIQAQSALNALLNQPLNNALSLSPPNTFPEGIPAHISTNDNSILPASDRVSPFDADLDQLTGQAETNRPEFLENDRQSDTARQQLLLAKANRSPNFSLSGGPDIVRGSESQASIFFTGNVELPVLNRQQGPIAEAEARLTQLSREKLVLESRVRLEVATAYTAFLQNRRRVTRYEREILPKAQVVVSKSQLAFEAGKASILIPVNAQQAYRNTQLGYQQALLDYQNAISDLERAIGSGI